MDMEAKYYLTQLLSALKYLHANEVIHCDIKPDNLFITASMQLKLGDFGVSRRISQVERRPGKTLIYAAPEVLKKSDYSYEVDVWAVGVLLFQFLLGDTPFAAHDKPSTRRKILNLEYSFPRCYPSAEAKSLISDILKESPSDRPSLQAICDHAFLQPAISIPTTLPRSCLWKPPSSVAIASLLRLEDIRLSP
jgi:serine/threonine protein kinase